MRRGREIVAASFIAFGLFSLLSVYTDSAGQAGAVIARWLTSGIGFAAGLPGLFVAWFGIDLWRALPGPRHLRRLLGFIAFVAAVITVLHVAGNVLVGSEPAQAAADPAWGGAAGAALADAAVRLIGPLGTALGVFMLSFVGWTLLVDVSPGQMWAGWRQRLAAPGDGKDLEDGFSEPASDEEQPDAKGKDWFGFLRRGKGRRRGGAADDGEEITDVRPDRSRRGRGWRRHRRNAEANTDATISSFALEGGDGPGAAETAAAGLERAASGRQEPRTVSDDGGGAGEDGTGPSRNGQARRERGDASRSVGPAAPASGNYTLPQTRLLARPTKPRRSRGASADDGRAELLEETLASFGIEGRVVSVSRGPAVTRFEVQPPPGVKVSRIVGLADDISLALAAAGVRIEAPVPGKSVVGIEVPNRDTSPVVLREILESDEFQNTRSYLTIGLGRDIAGKPLVADLQKLLHLLIAGATGSGKSVCLNSIITSLLYKADPDQVKMMMIDPKRVELSVYDGIPHLITPVVTDPKEAAAALRWAVKEMERRYQLLSKTGVRNLDAYNRRRHKPEGMDEFVPYLVVIIDELADLMLVASADVENSIVRLAQMARAAGIYLIIATQRPSVDVITGLIKANVPSRLAFAVSSQVDSRTILDMGGAERLLGRGDMLFYPIGAPKPVRAQGAWVSDAEVEAVADAWRAQGEPQYVENVTEPQPSDSDEEAAADDELFDEAVALVREQGHASVSMLQRRFRIGYARAARLIDIMEVQGIVGPYQGSKPREVIGIDGAL